MSFQAKSLLLNFQNKKFPPTLYEAIEFAEEGSEHPALSEVIYHVDPGT